MRGEKQAGRSSMMAIAAVLVGMLLVSGSIRPIQAAQEDGPVTVEMTEYEGSGISGTAVLSDSPDGDGVVVQIALDNVGSSRPTHIHEGTCATVDPLVPIYPLADVDGDGKSVTTVPDVALADITTIALVIVVHKSLAELPVVVSCGEIPVASKSGDGANTGVGGGTPGEVPTTGVGSAIGVNDSNSAVLIALSFLAMVLLVAGISLRRLEGRTNTGVDTAI